MPVSSGRSAVYIHKYDGYIQCSSCQTHHEEHESPRIAVELLEDPHRTVVMHRTVQQLCIYSILLLQLRRHQPKAHVLSLMRLQCSALKHFYVHLK